MPEPTATFSKHIHSDPGILGGTPVFLGTRVPVKTLFDCLEGGGTLDDFMEDFPSVSTDAIRGALRHGRQLQESTAQL